MSEQTNVGLNGSRASELLEPWLDKRKLAAHLSCSVRSIELAMAKGLPHSTIFGRAKFQVSTVLPWLEEHGYADTLHSPDERSANAA